MADNEKSALKKKTVNKKFGKRYFVKKKKVLSEKRNPSAARKTVSDRVLKLIGDSVRREHNPNKKFISEKKIIKVDITKLRKVEIPEK